MRIHTSAVLAAFGLAALALTAWLGSAAQVPQMLPAGAQAQRAETARGELKALDATAKAIVVSVTGKEMRFQYNDQTRVIGASGIAALASMVGQQVTVQYTISGANHVALSIEVMAR